MQGDLGIALAALSCGTFVIITEPATVRVLRRLAAIDTPNLRSSHAVPTPRGGGAPIALGLLLSALLVRGTPMLILGAVAAAFAVLGFADDLAGLPAGRRLLLQGALGLAAGAALAGWAGLGTAAAAVTAVLAAVWITGYVNAFNFMDGVNGISGTHAALAGAAYAAIGWLGADGWLAAGGAAVAAGALAFLPWNARRAQVFLGDSGSYGLGAALAVLAAAAVLRGVAPEAAAGPLALYLADTSWTLQRRIRAGEPWLRAHRTHAYQRLCDVGWSHQKVTLATGAVTAAVSLLGAVSLTGRPELRVAADLAALALLAAYLRAPAALARRARRARRAARRAAAATAPEPSMERAA